MAERAHPEDPGFRRGLFLEWRGRRPKLRLRLRNPYREAFEWRYRWASHDCAGRDVLDVPCGMGWGTSLIAGARSLVGVDRDADAIAEARRRYGGLARFETGDMAALAFADASFDVVVCLEGIEHVPVEVGERFVEEAARVLRPGGLLLLSSPHSTTGAHSGNPYHAHEYRPEEIRALVGRRFEIEDEAARRVDDLEVLYVRARVRSRAR